MKKKISKKIQHKLLKLYEPIAYRLLSEEARKAYCNGCGSGRIAFLTPDSILGVSVKDSCNIHDFMYEFAKPYVESKEEADRIFLNNMTRQILNKNHGFFKFLTRKRLKIAKLYYDAVKNYGGASFWEDKNI